VSVQEIVRSIVEDNPLYDVMLASGIANMSALARAIKPLVDAALGRSVKLTAVIKALERIRASRRPLGEAAPLLANVDVVVYSDVAEVPGARPEALAEAPPNRPAFIISVGGHVKTIASAQLLGAAAKYSLIGVIFPEEAPVGAVTALVLLLRARGIAVEHVLRVDNEVYLMVPHDVAPEVLRLIEAVKSFWGLADAGSPGAAGQRGLR
jgi:hypothetical protein